MKDFSNDELEMIQCIRTLIDDYTIDELESLEAYIEIVENC